MGSLAQIELGGEGREDLLQGVGVAAEDYRWRVPTQDPQGEGVSELMSAVAEEAEGMGDDLESLDQRRVLRSGRQRHGTARRGSGSHCSTDALITWTATSV